MGPNRELGAVDTRIKVTDVAELAGRLDGAQLYGHDNLAPLRELIQNAADAIRARRFIERRPLEFGDVRVRLGNDSEGHWVEVADNGIGMTEKVMTGPLLDFGSSFWNSESMMQELPGLAASGFQSTGKYGIGFFSLFMWGSHVRITSRSYRDAPRDTRVLEFTKGLSARPILRNAVTDEFLRDGGTAVRIWVGPPPESDIGVLYRPQRRRKRLEEMCEWLCPAVDVNIYVDRDLSQKLVIRGSDWKTLDGKKLLSRLDDDYEQSAFADREEKALARLTARNLTIVYGPAGETIGRIAVIPQDYAGVGQFGAVTTGGLRACGLYRIAGVLEGQTTTADRSYAIPTIEQSKLADWATAQMKLLARMSLDQPTLTHSADTISRCGGDIGLLPIAETSASWFSAEDIRSRRSLPDRIILVDMSDVYSIQVDYGPLKLAKNVFVCEEGPGSFLVTRASEPEGWPEKESSGMHDFSDRSNKSTAVRLLAERWSVSLEALLAAAKISSDRKYYWEDIGTVHGKPLSRSVSILNNPNRKSTHDRKHKRGGKVPKS